MRSMTPTEARKNWFRLLDEVAEGEVVEIRRGEKRIILRCEEAGSEKQAPDYSHLIQGNDVDQADSWGWEWDEENFHALSQ